ncbi:MAG TPA: ricin-type beta-trefoil lectin domain protein, partial [Candidatus Saccharimonadales bacterium]
MKWVHKRGTALAVQSLSKRLQGFRHWSAALSLTKLAGFVAVFAIVGVLILLAAHAATGASILGLSPQNGRLCGNAAVVSDPSAVGGSALKFGTGGGGPSCPGGTPTLSQTGELSAYLAELINGNGSTTPLCLADQNNSSADNNPVVVDGCSATAPEQQWSLYSDNSIRINGKCLSPQNGKTQSGTAVVIAACDGTAAQQWNIGNDVSVSLNDLHNGGASGVCLDVPNAEMTSVPGDTPGGSAVTILNCDGTLDEQIWGWNTDGTITPGGVTAGANCHDSATLYSGFGTCYWEAHGIQHSPFSSTGFSVDMTQASPKVPVYNRVGTISHSLMEVWAGGGTASSGGGGTLNFGSTPADTLEFGWIKNGDGKPSHLFVTYWQNYTLRC